MAKRRSPYPPEFRQKRGELLRDGRTGKALGGPGVAGTADIHRNPVRTRRRRSRFVLDRSRMDGIVQAVS